MFFKSELFTQKSWYLILGTWYLFITSCAIKVTPTGGEKDILPPKILKSIPENNAVSFSTKIISIQFDEYVQLKEPGKQIIISPIIAPAPEFSIKNKSVEIKIDAPLQPNTTYTFNFGNAIADVNESNALEGFQYVFSTGTYIDSLQINGSVKVAENLKTEKGILVMLYKSNTDSIPYLSPPDYFAKTDTAGNFSIKNISNSSYKIFALKETDGNYLFNATDEFIAYSREEVNANDTTTILLKLFKEAPAKLFLKSKFIPQKGKCVLVFNKSAQNISFTNINTNELPVKFQEFSQNKDSLTLWMNDTSFTSLNFIIKENDFIVDTVNIKPASSESQRGKGENSSTLKLSATSSVNELIKPNDTLMLTFNQPMDTTTSDVQFIQLFKDSVPVKNFTTYFIDEISRKLKVVFIPEEKSAYRLLILPKSFTSIYGLSNDTLNFNFTTQPATSLGSVLLKISGLADANFLLQLLNEKDELIIQRKINGNGNYLFEYLNPMKYKIRIIADANANGKWDTGNYLQNLQPEKVFYYKEELNIRANWDVEQEWKVEMKN